MAKNPVVPAFVTQLMPKLRQTVFGCRFADVTQLTGNKTQPTSLISAQVCVSTHSDFAEKFASIIC